MKVKETRSIESTLAQKIIEDYNNELTIRSISKKIQRTV